MNAPIEQWHRELAVQIALLQQSHPGSATTTSPVDIAQLLANAEAEWGKKWEVPLKNLLAYIHRDGGHYETEHSTEKAVEDALKIREVERQQLDEARELICDAMAELARIGWSENGPEYDDAQSKHVHDKLSKFPTTLDSPHLEAGAVTEPVGSTPAESTIFNEVLEALHKAQSKHPPMRSHHEGYAILLEELDELWEEVKRDDLVACRKECLHVAAMAIRFLYDVCRNDNILERPGCPTELKGQRETPAPQSLEGQHGGNVQVEHDVDSHAQPKAGSNPAPSTPWQCPHCGSADGTWFDRTLTYNRDGTEQGMWIRCVHCGEILDEPTGKEKR